jgi:exonuclease SbcC
LNAVNELENVTSEISDAEKQAKSLTKDIDANKKLFKKSTEKLKSKKTEEKASVAAGKKLSSLERKIDDLDALLESADVESATKAFTKASAEWEKCHKAFNEAESQLAKARRERTRHLAGELAASLVKDDECPVCGSTSHPKKAKKTAEIDISTLENKRDKAQIKKTDAENRQIREIIRAVTEALDIPCHDSEYSSESFCDWLERNEREKTIDRHAKRVLLRCHLKMVDNEKVVDDVLEALSAENL